MLRGEVLGHKRCFSLQGCGYINLIAPCLDRQLSSKPLLECLAEGAIGPPYVLNIRAEEAVGPLYVLYVCADQWAIEPPYVLSV